jgi:hypothetical protein
MRKRRTNVAQVGAVGVLVVIVIAVVVMLVIVDVATTPSPPRAPQDTCTLVHHIVLPDACVCSTAGRTCHPSRTRPYLIFFQQAAAYPTLGCDVDLR